MSIAAVPKYLGQDFKDASPGMRFGLLLPIWTDRADQEKEVRKRAEAKSREGQQLADTLQRQGMEATIAALCRQDRLPKCWEKNTFAARQAWENVKSLGQRDRDCMHALAQRLAAQTATLPLNQRLTLEALATAPFTTGLGNEHPLENGFAFLNPYGLPYLPGSGVKGVVRRAAQELATGDWGDARGWSTTKGYTVRAGEEDIRLSVIDVLFGLESSEGSTQHVRGALSFWDAIPQIAGESLLVEIMTPHQAHYYQQKRDRKAGDSTSPHDSGQPNPIAFLTVPPGSSFVFHVICDVRHLVRLTRNPIDPAPDLLGIVNGRPRWQVLLTAAFEHAFQWLGFGAKTAVGYGAMQRVAAAAQAHRSNSPQGEPVAPRPRSPWVDAKLAELCQRPSIKPDDALRGTALAEAVRAIEDPALRAQALGDIQARWQEKGWWAQPSGGAAKKAKAIYDELLKVLP